MKYQDTRRTNEQPRVHQVMPWTIMSILALLMCAAALTGTSEFSDIVPVTHAVNTRSLETEIKGLGYLQRSELR